MPSSAYPLQFYNYMAEREVPHALFRVTMPSKLSAHSGFFKPHDNNSEHGLSLPMIAKKDLLPICAIFGGQYMLKETGDNYFLILTFHTNKLINPRLADPLSVYEEYYAIAPVNALISATKFTWGNRDEVERAWYSGHLKKSLNYLGKEDLSYFTQP